MHKFNTIIIGAGFGGLCMGIKLRMSGRDDFIILEKAEALGGTWRENTYPGAECDIPSALYSYSFEHNADWEFKWSGQKQILKYQNDTAKKYGLEKHLRFSQGLKSAQFVDGRWRLKTDSGEEYDCQHLITAVGQLHHPSTPQIKGASTFAGEQFHSAKWRHDLDLDHQRIAVIGNAASAVQLIPEIAKCAAQVTVYQRSPNWILPKVDRAYSSLEQRLSIKFPWLARLYRKSLWVVGEFIVLPAIRGRWLARKFVRFLCTRNLKSHIKDVNLQQQLIPDYPVGAKRVLFSDGYYPALGRDNVDLNTHGIDQVVKEGIIDKSGELQEFDQIIYATGFKTNPFLSDMEITGLDDVDLHEHWAQGAFAYYGVSTAGFPNLHMMYGPNTNLGHSSIIIMLEAQADHILRMIGALDQAGKQSLEVVESVEVRFNAELQNDLKKLAFSEVDHSWYIDHGRVTNNWSAGTRHYCRQLKAIDIDDFIMR